MEKHCTIGINTQETWTTSTLTNSKWGLQNSIQIYLIVIASYKVLYNFRLFNIGVTYTGHIREQRKTPTSFRAKAIGLVTVIVLSGGTPAVSIIPALRGAAVVAFSLKAEGEFTRRALSVTTKGEKYCKNRKKKYVML